MMSRYTLAAALVWLLALVIGRALSLDGVDVRAPDSGFWGPELFAQEPFEIFLHIARQNLVVLLLLAAGSLSGGLITVSVLAFNGVILGMEIAIASASGMGVAALAVVLLPHGVAEMGALLAAAGMGLRSPWRYLAAPADILTAAPALGRKLAVLSLLIVGAAAIETWVTLPLAEVVARAQTSLA